MSNLPSSVSARNSSSKNQQLANKDRQEEVAARDDHTSVTIPAVGTSFKSRLRQRMHRVPPQVRQNKTHIYDPVVVSIGPYHHGKSHLLQAEEMKEYFMNNTFASTKDRDLFHGKVVERIDEIKSLYEGVEPGVVWPELIIRDACLILHYMKGGDDDIKLLHFIGLSGAAFLSRDVLMIENQIPFWVIKLLIGLVYDEEEGKSLLCKFLSFVNFGDPRLTQVPWDEEHEPLHLLEAHRMTLLKHSKISSADIVQRHLFPASLLTWVRRKPAGFQSENIKLINPPFRSITDLKAKGIYFSPSSNCLTDIRFDSYSFYGKLQIPIKLISNNSSVFFSNVIAFEMSPGANTDCAVISYVNFTKSLIDNTKDVKELREKGILFSNLGNDEEVVKMFKEINTYGLDNVDTFLDVKERIDKHCDRKLRTWMGDPIHTYLNPWTVIALFPASLLLCLTFLQTLFTIWQPKEN